MNEPVEQSKKPKIYAIYREYTGDCYEIRAVATDKITGIVSVVFRGWPDLRVGWFTIPLDTFNERVSIPAGEVPAALMDLAVYDEDGRALVPRYTRRVP